MPRPVTTNTSGPLCECFFLRGAAASPSGIAPGASTEPFWTVAPEGSTGMIAESGRSTGAGGGAVVVVVDESFGFLFLSALVGVVVVGAGAAVTGAWVPAGAAEAGGLGAVGGGGGGGVV